ncbi:response regulator transcription factor [Candidatus Laterigemmans baculatus]|uniref:response regulator transcription factor n=1 Tax=Candidatus Laterigemmans baculatus TaxID=2770505 RepID=UPI0013DA5CAB|nr:response regulator transcription factor [Candidatus Laterigemmans baculatus]
MSNHILIVEDEEHLGVGIKYNLEAEGYRVTWAGDGPTALKRIEHDAASIDAIVLDLMLPGMSGYAVCETIRARGLSIPILMLSARTLTEDRTRGFNVGANQYMSKPFELDELLSRIKNLLNLSPGRDAAPRRVKSEPLEQTEFGRVHVNFVTHEVMIAGEPVKMTPKELRLLQYFATNPGRVITRQELLSEVWEMSGNLQTRAVDQFIVRLRKIVEENPSQPKHILTIRDAGYRFVA